MAEPILLRPRNIAFHVLGLKEAWCCAACGRDGSSGEPLRCERCAVVVMHYDCYWERIASATEERDSIEMARDGDSPAILCLGCRS